MMGKSAALNIIRIPKIPTMDIMANAGIKARKIKLSAFKSPLMATYRLKADEINLSVKKTNAGNEKALFSSTSASHKYPNILLLFFSFCFPVSFTGILQLIQR